MREPGRSSLSGGFVRRFVLLFLFVVVVTAAGAAETGIPEKVAERRFHMEMRFDDIRPTPTDDD